MNANVKSIFKIYETLLHPRKVLTALTLKDSKVVHPG